MLQSVSLLSTLFTSLSTFNRRSLDPLSAKIYSFYALVCESTGKDAEIRKSEIQRGDFLLCARSVSRLRAQRSPVHGCAAFRFVRSPFFCSQLLLAHRTACLQHNEPGQAALSVCILRNYLSHHLYSQADTFRLKSNFPDQRSNAQTARYCYYIGKIQAVQLHYSDAFASLTQALRKAPQKAAVGFRQVCTKLLILVQLLMGDIPERSLFSPKDLRKSLAPYLQLTQAVRVGDLNMFNETVGKHKAVFDRDGIESLIVRLRSNVIKAGLRKINLAYSKISLADVCAKLSLDNREDAEYMVAKAIHDGVIEAVVDRANGVVYSKEIVDVYATTEPQQAYHKRIQFTMDIHQQAVKVSELEVDTAGVTSARLSLCSAAHRIALSCVRACLTACRQSLRYPGTGSKTRHEWESSDEEDEDLISGNAPDKREEDKKKDDK